MESELPDLLSKAMAHIFSCSHLNENEMILNLFRNVFIGINIAIKIESTRVRRAVIRIPVVASKLAIYV